MNDHAGFMPHGYCYLWNPGLVTLHVASDALIGLAYFSIPLALWYFVRKRADVPFSWIFTLFGTFIVACGLTHFLSIITLWNPIYWTDGAVKAVTAAASVGTSIVLFPLIPKALALRSPADLERLNGELEALLREKEGLLTAYERAHHVATTLQQALLPQEMPRVGGLSLHSTYHPAVAGMEVGGDWFDAFALSETLLGISCGDVAGHGLRAATVMGTARQMIRVVAREDDDPAVVLGRVNRSMCADEGGVLVTAFYGVLDVRTGALRYTLAGHPGPIRTLPDAPAAVLQGSGLVLGVDADASYATLRTQLPEGSLLVLYTDGIVEVEHNLPKGIDDLRTAVELEFAQPSENLAEGIAQRIFAQRPPRDDVAILTVRVDQLNAEAVERHRRIWHVDASDGRRGTQLRSAIVRYLAEYGSNDSDYGIAELVVGELIGNVARHTPGPARVEIEWRNGLATLVVEDEGPPYDPLAGDFGDVMREHGRGLALVRMFAGNIAVRRTARGNAISLTLPVTLA